MAASGCGGRFARSGLSGLLVALGVGGTAAAASRETAASVEQAIAAVLHLAPSARLDMLQDGATSMPACQQTLEVAVSHGGTYRRATLSCRRPAWRAYAELRISQQIRVAVARHALPPGTPITADDFTVQTIASSSIAGTAAALTSIEGSQAAVPIPAHRPITVNDLTRPVATRAGQHVTVHLQTAGVSVSFAAVVLQNASFGQSVLVENAETHKRLTATLVRPGAPVPNADTLYFRAAGGS